MATLLGGVELDVETMTGAKLTVKVRQVPISLFPRYADCVDKEAQMIELLCSAEKDWADTLTIESCERILKAGEDLNADFFARWLQRRMERVEKMYPGKLDQMAQLVASRLATTLPTSPAAAASPSPKPGSTP